MALPGKFKAKKRKGKKPPKFSLWRAFSWVCATATEPIPNVISDSELAGWMFVLYVVAGWAYYNLSTGTLTFGDASYFLTATMTTVGYGDVTPAPTPHARLVGLAFVVVGNLVALSGLNELAAYLVELRDRVLASTRAAVLQAASKSPPSAENPGTGGDGSGSGGGPGRGSREASLEDLLDEDAAAMLAKFSKVEESLATTLARRGVTGWRAQLSFAYHLPFLARQRFPVIDVVGALGVYLLFWGWLFSLVEDMTLVDAMYMAMVTGTTVGYGDVSPQTVAGRWLAVAFLPFAVVFIGTQMAALQDAVSGSTVGGALSKLMALDLSLEALLEMDEDGDGSITEFEFLRFMLVKADLADEGVLDSLHDRFSAMDADGSGALTAADLPRPEPLCGGSGPVPAAAVAAALAAGRAEHALACPAEVAGACAVTRQRMGQGLLARRPTPPPAAPPALTVSAAGAAGAAAAAGGGSSGGGGTTGNGAAQTEVSADAAAFLADALPGAAKGARLVESLRRAPLTQVARGRLGAKAWTLPVLLEPGALPDAFLAARGLSAADVKKLRKALVVQATRVDKQRSGATDRGTKLGTAM